MKSLRQATECVLKSSNYCTDVAGPTEPDGTLKWVFSPRSSCFLN